MENERVTTRNPADSPILEIAVDTLRDGVDAVAAGASRLEVCSRLDLGGLTPPEELVRALARHVQVPLFVMIRPRGGDFLYSSEECDEMRRLIVEAKTWGAHGFVLGMLTSGSAVDVVRTRQFVELASPFPVTFHRAFDRCSDLDTSARDLAGAGVTRILTSGGRMSAEEGLETLRDLHRAVGRDIIIVPGGGVRPANIRKILDVTGVTEVHSAARDANGKFDGGLVEQMIHRMRGS